MRVKVNPTLADDNHPYIKLLKRGSKVFAESLQQSVADGDVFTVSRLSNNWTTPSNYHCHGSVTVHLDRKMAEWKFLPSYVIVPVSSKRR